MDFYKIKERTTKNGVEIFPDFKIGRSKDLMIRGRTFYAIWDEETGLWSTDEYDVQRLVDTKLQLYKDKTDQNRDGVHVKVKFMSDLSSNSWSEFRRYLNLVSDNAHQLDTKLTFQNTKVSKNDYVSKKLNYSIGEGSKDNYETLISTLYDKEDREKIEWAIGSIVSGESINIQKFLVFYGEAGSGKSTVLNIIQKLFQGYYTTFDAKMLTSNNNTFSTEVFKSNPLVAIQHDGDLSKIEDNTKLNSIVSHEEMSMNEKYKSAYTARINSFLFMGTNKPVKITDAKSGVIRRLIDVRPSGRKIETHTYNKIMTNIDFELGAIAHHCLQVFNNLGKNYFNSYRPINMIFQTDIFYNFIEDQYHILSTCDGISLKQAYTMYKEYCDDALVEYKLQKHKFREELKSYFEEFSEIARIDGKQIRSYYSKFKHSLFNSVEEVVSEKSNSTIVLDKTTSILDSMLQDCPAQYAKKNGEPLVKWSNLSKKDILKNVNTKKLHYVKPNENHIVIDFDLKDETGNKNIELNLAAANNFPLTYCEISKSGSGLHLHYIYGGDIDKLDSIYDEDIEIKVFKGNSALRRKLTKCNNEKVAIIYSGLPLRKEKKDMVNLTVIQNDKQLRGLINKALKKEIHKNTKPNIDFIKKLVDDAIASGIKYDITDLRGKIINFAASSTHQADNCLDVVKHLQFKSEENEEESNTLTTGLKDSDLTFFDVEVFKNLFVVVWKHYNKKPVRMINPSAVDIENILTFNLVGFNCRRYDNHILYAAILGYSNLELYNLSQKIINNSSNATFSEAYRLSYTDIYDFSSKKQSLKKFEIELGIHHVELGLDWNEPVPEHLWTKVAEYCENDVIATEKVFMERYQDYVARKIISSLSGLSMNDTTQNHTAKIIFGNDKKPQEKFNYVDLSEEFEGYTYEAGKSYYRNELTGEGGYVYAEPGMYTDVLCLDIESMHPTSIVAMNLFGVYTIAFKELMNARLAVKHKQIKNASSVLNGVLTPYLKDDKSLEDLSYALKIIINIVYGLTSAKFPNKFRDVRNVDNIVAKRGALFMIELKHKIQSSLEYDSKVLHIKTDSIKLEKPSKELVEFILSFGEKYKYKFDVEAEYSKICLINDAVYIAKTKAGEWTATGAQFAHPYVFKTLFSKEKITIKDLSETKSVSTAMYLYMDNEEGGDYVFIGKVGSFLPIKPNCGGGKLYRKKDDDYHAVIGTKNYYWLETEMVEKLKKEHEIDYTYYNELLEKAKKAISEYTDVEWFCK